MTTGGKAYPVVAPPWVFYSSPFCPKGIWLRSELCTAQVDCSYCGSKKWQPCKSIQLGKALPGHSLRTPKFERVVGGYIGMTHVDRRKAAKKLPSQALEITVRGLSEEKGGPPGGGYKIALSLPPLISPEEAEDADT